MSHCTAPLVAVVKLRTPITKKNTLDMCMGYNGKVSNSCIGMAAWWLGEHKQAVSELNMAGRMAMRVGVASCAKAAWGGNRVMPDYKGSAPIDSFRAECVASRGWIYSRKRLH